MNLAGLPDRHGYDLSAKKPRRWRARTKAEILRLTMTVRKHFLLPISSLNLPILFFLPLPHRPRVQCPHRRNTLLGVELPKRRLTIRHIWIRQQTWEWI